METTRLRAIQLPGNAGTLLDSFRRYDQSGAIEEESQRCYE